MSRHSPSHACPQCHKPAGLPSENGFAPFCCERCKAIDLARWFGGDYRVAGEPVADLQAALQGEPGDEEGAGAASPPPARRRPH